MDVCVGVCVGVILVVTVGVIVGVTEIEGVTVGVGVINPTHPLGSSETIIPVPPEM